MTWHHVALHCTILHYTHHATSPREARVGPMLVLEHRRRRRAARAVPEQPLVRPRRLAAALDLEAVARVVVVAPEQSVLPPLRAAAVGFSGATR